MSTQMSMPHTCPTAGPTPSLLHDEDADVVEACLADEAVIPPRRVYRHVYAHVWPCVQARVGHVPRHHWKALAEAVIMSSGTSIAVR